MGNQRIVSMNRRGFFAKFAAIAAAVPIVGKLVPRVVPNPAYDGHRDMILHVRDFRAENYVGNWRWELSDPEAIIRIDT